MFNRLFALGLATVTTIVCVTPAKADAILDEQLQPEQQVDYFNGSILDETQDLPSGFKTEPIETNEITWKDILRQQALNAEEERLHRDDPAQTAIDQAQLTQKYYPTLYDSPAADAANFTHSSISILRTLGQNYLNQQHTHPSASKTSSSSTAFSPLAVEHPIVYSRGSSVRDDWEDDSPEMQCYMMERGIECE